MTFISLTLINYETAATQHIMLSYLLLPIVTY